MTEWYVREKTHYQRQLNPIKDAIDQMAFYLHKMTGDSIEQCRIHVTQQIKTKGYPNLKDPVVRFNERNDEGDKCPTQIKLSQYIKVVNQNKEVLAPSFTSYIPASVKPSLLVKYMDRNTKLRSIAKKASFKAEALGDTFSYLIYNNEQVNRKQGNNSVSGGMVAEGTVINNPSGHSTLTSTTRCVSSLGNSSNEKIIGGNRHYRNPEIVINNLVYTASITNHQEVEFAIRKYQLNYPSIKDVMDCIIYSSKLYWHNRQALLRIETFVGKMTATERAAFVYSSDLYHIRKLNDQFIHKFLSEMGNQESSILDDREKLIEEIWKTDEALLNLTHQICSDAVKGMGKEYKDMDTSVLQKILGTARHLEVVLNYYQDFLKAFFVSNIMPASIAYIPSMLRRVVVLSDTDSTCASQDEWVEWYQGEIVFDETSRAVAGSVMYVATQALVHTLAMFSANIGCEEKRLHTLAMKSEFYWDLMVPTNVSKHYWAWTLIREGNVFKDHKLELKGVHLKSSNLPKLLIERSKDLIISCNKTLMENKKLVLVDLLKYIIDIENEIATSLKNHELTYFISVLIKEASAYAEGPEESNYRHYLFWNEIFKEKYGEIQPPPYPSIKVATTLKNPTALRNWLSSIQDPSIRSKLETWIIRKNKKDFKTIWLPVQFVGAFGIMEEVQPIVDIKRMVLDLCKILYMVLEALGYYKKPKMLLSEHCRHVVERGY